uniref:Uncharacterized protein n=1 Tax=Cacopsylla melanoneura TaxID=428564 RepID=A0A8D8YFR2_9HEMI
MLRNGNGFAQFGNEPCGSVIHDGCGRMVWHVLGNCLSAELMERWERGQCLMCVVATTVWEWFMPENGVCGFPGGALGVDWRTAPLLLDLCESTLVSIMVGNS